MSTLVTAMLNALIITLAVATVVFLLGAIWVVLEDIRDVARDEARDEEDSQ